MLKGFKHIQHIIISNTGETQDYGGSLSTILGLWTIMMSFILLLQYEMGSIYFALLLWIWSFLLIDGNNYLIRKRDSIFSEILALNKTLQKSKNKIDDIDSISSKIEQISYLFQDLIYNSHFTSLLYSRITSKEQLQLINDELLLLIDYLTDLRSDLKIRLIEHQKTLKNAEIEVETNIHWTTELNQVSELQKARLDRQIEQFEELQRVLIKI